ncbi:MAG: helix-turn-helix domain-containing protein [Candidatus Avilachnospira sp.]
MISYRKLWIKLKKESLPYSYMREKAKISPGTFIKLKNNEPVSLYSLEKICRSLDCNIGEIMEYVGD